MRRNRFSQLCDRSPTHRRALRRPGRRFARPPSRIGRTWPSYPYSAARVCASSQSYPLSRHSPCGAAADGSGRSTGMLSIVSRISLWSLRLAPSTAAPIGTPAAAVRTLRLTPSWPRSVGCLPVFFPPERGLRQGPVHRLPAPLDALEPVVLGQAELPESEEDSGIGPLLEPAMGRGVRADAGGVERAPLAAGAEQE